jgi:putative oxidoreductase
VRALHGGSAEVKAAALVLRVALGILFVWAALAKLPDMRAFAQDVANYRVLPAGSVAFVASAVVGIELLAGVLLVVGIYERPAAIAVSVLLAAFTAFVVQALLRGIDLRCGCFGGDERASWWTVLRDLGMLAASVALALGIARKPAAAA